jgi:glycerate kinase
MNVLIALDSFKDALDANAACEAVTRGIIQAMPSASCRTLPLADGGEGTAAILANKLQAEKVTLTALDPLLRPREAHYFYSPQQRTAMVEMAAASGLQLLAPDERNPIKTSTFGTGELVADALRRGAQQVFLGIGGSATNDGGMGMAAALGWEFLDARGQTLPPTGQSLRQITRIKLAAWPAEYLARGKSVRLTLICDVSNPLTGPRGASRVFSPQKGATPEAVAELEAGLGHFAALVSAHFGEDFSQVPGTGAGGGLAFGALAFLQASIHPGAALVLEIMEFEQALAWADLVVTGEGKLDAQTLDGKLIHGVCRAAALAGVPVIALCGTLELTPAQLTDLGLRAAFSTMKKPQSLSEALNHAAFNLEELAVNIFRTIDLRKFNQVQC